MKKHLRSRLEVLWCLRYADSASFADSPEFTMVLGKYPGLSNRTWFTNIPGKHISTVAMGCWHWWRLAAASLYFGWSRMFFAVHLGDGPYGREWWRSIQRIWSASHDSRWADVVATSQEGWTCYHALDKHQWQNLLCASRVRSFWWSVRGRRRGQLPGGNARSTCLKRNGDKDEIIKLFTPDPKRIRKADTVSSPACSV